jgi:hypothetical protein
MSDLTVGLLAGFLIGVLFTGGAIVLITLWTER